tara:strand:- start:60691 stop:62979 length:2289 start_codon:yes stop_codon:yes gene_type:complete
MSESPLNWQTFSIGEWNDYLKEQSKLNRPDINQEETNHSSILATVLKKNEKPNTIIDWLRLICFVQSKNHILTSSSEKERRLRIFELKNTIQLPLECLGPNAQRFIKTAKYNYKYGAWAPPIRPELIYTIYTLFDQLNADLTEDLGWRDFWLEQQDIIISRLDGVSSFDTHKYFCLLKEDILSAYRSIVIKNTSFLEALEEEDDVEQVMNDSRVIEHFEAINYYKSFADEKSCYKALSETYYTTLEAHVLKAMTKAKNKLLAGGSITKVVNFLKREILEARSLSAYACLPLEKAESTLSSLISVKKDYQQIMRVIDGHLDSIANQFVPSFDQDSGVRVLNLILQAREAILSTDVFEKRQEVGKLTLKKYLGSTEAITRTYNLALIARTDFFSQYLPNDIDKLINDEVCGIKWIRYPRARREVLSHLFNEVLTNSYKYPKPPFLKRILGLKISQEQQETLLKLQEAYFDSYVSDFKLCLPAEAEKLLLIAQSDKILSPISHSIFTTRIVGAPKEKMALLTKIVEEKKQLDKNATDTLLYENDAPPEHDITYGLFYELSQMLDNEEDRLETNDLAPDEEESAISSSQGTVIEFPRDIDAVDVPIEELLYSKIQHTVLSVRLNNIVNPEERLGRINSLFKQITCPDNYHRHSKGLGRLLQHKYNVTQKSAIATLQTCYIQALQEAWVLKAQSYYPSSQSNELPEYLDITQKNQIFMEYMRTAKKSKIMNCEISHGSVDQLHFQIHRMIMALNNIPEKDLFIQNMY